MTLSNSFNGFMYVRWVTCIGWGFVQCIYFVVFNEIASYLFLNVYFCQEIYTLLIFEIVSKGELSTMLYLTVFKLILKDNYLQWQTMDLVIMDYLEQGLNPTE